MLDHELHLMNSDFWLVEALRYVARACFRRMVLVSIFLVAFVLIICCCY